MRTKQCFIKRNSNNKNIKRNGFGFSKDERVSTRYHTG